MFVFVCLDSSVLFVLCIRFARCVVCLRVMCLNVLCWCV